jgi:hypothetical protein
MPRQKDVGSDGRVPSFLLSIWFAAKTEGAGLADFDNGINEMAYPDYYVTAVKYNPGSAHIAMLKIHAVDPRSGRWNSTGEELTRPKVIELVRRGKSFYTITEKTEGGWKLGARLQVFPVPTDYLKTIQDESAQDNLESLPSF